MHSIIFAHRYFSSLIAEYFAFFTGYLQSGCKSLQKRSWWIIQICSSLDHFLEGQVITFIYLPLSCSLDPATNSETANRELKLNSDKCFVEKEQLKINKKDS